MGCLYRNKGRCRWTHPETTDQTATRRRQGMASQLAAGKATPDQLIQQAKSYLGIKHCIGDTIRSCMDCSGMLKRIFNDLGIDVPHGSEALSHYGRVIIEPEQFQIPDGSLRLRQPNLLTGRKTISPPIDTFDGHC